MNPFALLFSLSCLVAGYAGQVRYEPHLAETSFENAVRLCADSLPPGSSACDEAAFLQEFYNSTGGNTTWIAGVTGTQFGWFTCPYPVFNPPCTYWTGVSVHADGCVWQIALPANNLTGQVPAVIGSFPQMEKINLCCNNLYGPLPPSMAQLSNLQQMTIGSNQLTGTIPQALLQLPDLNYFNASDNCFDSMPPFVKPDMLVWVDSNKLTFDDILPSLMMHDTFYTYFDQDSIFSDTCIIRNTGDTLVVDLGIDEDIFTNQYTWYKDGDSLYTLSTRKLTFSPLEVDDAGNYWCRVKNPNAPQLELKTYNIKIVVNCVGTANLSLAASAPTACAGENVNVTVSGFPSPPGFQGPVSIDYTINGTPHIDSNLAIVNNSTAFSISGLSPNSYSLQITEVTDGEGCAYAANASGTIVVSDPQVSLGQDVSLCAGGSQTLSPSGTWQSYMWSTGATTPTITVSTANTYSVTVTSTAGCTATDAVAVIVSPSVSLGSDVSLCAGGSQTLSPSGTWQSYMWSTGATTPTITVSTANTYSVTVTSTAGCTATDAVAVIVSPSVSLGSDVSLCAGGSQTLSPSGTWQSYMWSTGATTPTITVSTANTYSVTVTAAGGCTATDAVAVSVSPSVSLGSDISLCAGGSQTLSPNGTWQSYMWSTGATTPTITVSTANTYSVTVTSTAGCTATDAVAVSVSPSVSLGSDISLCAGGSQTLSPNGTWQSYMWSTGATTPTITVSTANTYSVTVTAAGGCTATDAVAVSVGSAVSLGANDTLCAPASKTLTPTGTWQSYMWSNNATTPTISVSTAGIYSVTVTSTSGQCTASSSVQISVSDINSMPAVAEVKCNGNADGSITLNPSGGFLPYRFSLDNQPFQPANTFDGLAVGTYSLVVKDASGCTDNDIVLVALDPLLSIQSFAGQDQAGICDAEVLLNASLPPGLTGEWTSSSSAMIEDETAPNTSVSDLEDGDNVFTWTISKPGCPDFSSDEVTIGQETRPFAEDDIFDLVQDSVHLKGNLTDNDESDTDWLLKVLNPPTEGELTYDQTGDFTWTPDGFTEQVQFTYSLCSETCPTLCDTATVTISMEEPKKDGGTYKGITANGDGKNDKLIFPELYDNAYPKNELLVFNRWGDVVHEKKNYNNEWDGIDRKTGQLLPAGTYFYILNLDLVEEEPIVGELLIVR